MCFIFLQSYFFVFLQKNKSRITMSGIIGRKKEIEELLELFRSD